MPPRRNWNDFDAKERKGSRPRCIALTDPIGGRRTVCDSLHSLVAPFATFDPDRDRWAPVGLDDPKEVSIGTTAWFLSQHRDALVAWWLSASGKLPQWDIVSTAEIDGRCGVVLVEAKAHLSELERGGKGPPDADSEGSIANDHRIRQRIEEASADLAEVTSMPWALTSASHYQLANRFTWAWKLASLGVPVVLVYLGFLDADEWPDAFRDHAHWESALRYHADGRVPAAIWNTRIDVRGTPLVPLMRSARVPHPERP